MSKCGECAKFESWLKEGETPFQRLERERKDSQMCLKYWAEWQKRAEIAEKRVAELETDTKSQKTA